MIEMHPDELFSKFYENASARKKKTLELINNACKKQSESDIKDFSIGTIARLIADDGGLSEQALRNKNAEDYRVLINQWAEYFKATTKKPKKEKTSTINDDILASISEPTTKALVGMLMSENKKLKRENSLLKEQTTFTIDMRPINDISRNKDVALVEPSYNLTDTEIDALRNAISNELMKHQGWTTDNYGRVKENGIQVYKAGYVTAIKKILNEI
ncbi:gamma-mobile-trio protein GmtX [Clostridium botulinum]|uniref:gamma-mobile-trio protein GmtX n=1 Tax=Clostridium botulinum TaxID=1491 RepID=UPI001A9212A7|nr:gamma-mobile-trio protein GmtX [Clostridium botulinum]